MRSDSSRVVSADARRLVGKQKSAVALGFMVHECCTGGVGCSMFHGKVKGDTMPANVESMAYVGEMPWHRQGTKVAEGVTAQEMLEQSGLNWPVRLFSVFATEKGEKFLSAPNHKAVVRMSPNRCPVPLGVVGKRYVPIQNCDAFRFFDPVIHDGTMTFETAGVLGLGERVWVLAKLAGEPLLVGGDDPVERYMLLVNDHTGSRCLTSGFSPIRVVCQNTLTAAMSTMKTSVAIRHVKSAKARMKELGEIMALAVKTFVSLEKHYNAMTKFQVSPEGAKTYFERVFPGDPAKSETVRTARQHVNFFRERHETVPDRYRESLWGAYNAVTFWVDHIHVNRSRVQNALKSTWFGSGQVTRNRAMSEALSCMNV